MKLYTEEQVKEIIDIAEFNKHLTHDDILKEFSPIELPSDDDMANASNHCKDGQVKVGFLRGVLWYQEQVLKQNQ